MEPTIEYLKELVIQTGEIIKNSYGKIQQIDYKGKTDLVTEADKKAEQFLINKISSRFNNHSIIAEESNLLSVDNFQKWFIDPLDGTTNFSHNFPWFAVSVGYGEGDNILLGAVYNPLTCECFYAEKNKGAWLNGKRIFVSQSTVLGDSLLVTGLPYGWRDRKDNNLDNFCNVSYFVQGVRRLGAAALELCAIASGRLDGLWEASLKPWDIAAGSLIAIEAGAKITSMKGDIEFFKPPFSILAANPKLHAQILPLLNDEKKKFRVQMR
jgi:myo-inositol-1(or 4)-monophosphatase